MSNRARSELAYGARRVTRPLRTAETWSSRSSSSRYSETVTRKSSTAHGKSSGLDIDDIGGQAAVVFRRRKSQPTKTPSASPASGARGMSVVTLTAIPTTNPVTAPTTTAAPALDLAPLSMRPRLLQPHGFEGFGPIVVVVDARDQALGDSVDEGVLALGFDAAPAPLGVHAYEDHDRVARIDELVDLDAPLSPRGSPVFKPARQALMASIVALIGRVVIVDLDRFMEEIPGRLASPRVALPAFPHELHVLLRHRLLLEPHLGEGAVP